MLRINPMLATQIAAKSAELGDSYDPGDDAADAVLESLSDSVGRPVEIVFLALLSACAAFEEQTQSGEISWAATTASTTAISTVTLDDTTETVTIQPLAAGTFVEEMRFAIGSYTEGIKPPVKISIYENGSASKRIVITTGDIVVPYHGIITTNTRITFYTDWPESQAGSAQIGWSCYGQPVADEGVRRRIARTGRMLFSRPEVGGQKLSRIVADTADDAAESAVMPALPVAQRQGIVQRRAGYASKSLKKSKAVSKSVGK